MSTKTNIAYELPATVKSLNAGWLATCQSAATVVGFSFLLVQQTPNLHPSYAQSGLLAVVESQLIAFIKSPSSYPHAASTAQMNALLIFTYAAFFFSLSAMISSLVLTDEFGELPVRASRRSNPIRQGLYDSSAASLLESYGARKSWRWVMWHWIFTLVASVVSVTVQVLLYVWLQETVAVKVVGLCIGVFGLLPLLRFVPHGIMATRRPTSAVVVTPVSPVHLRGPMGP
ncbi:hypothetical protein FA95DRAFT_1039715 [Auriscalpium vulgare]|uniref:Uncharacterized protein n=1 Tax=Auriscalpium vulgare TaxID=40419 RepID=A0ACB8RWX9_9AGAM|nr:hypothetical protein FA95DRAFT_1039715 [Auriscalpium vulgare]